MATVIKVAGADFSANAVGFMPPVSSGLQAWHFTNGTAAKAKRNLAPGGTDATVVGTPVESAGYMGLDGDVNYFATPYTEVASFTWFVVARTSGTLDVTALKPMLISTYQGGNSPSLYIERPAGQVAPAGRFLMIDTRDNGSGVVATTFRNLDLADVTAFRFYAVTAESGVGARMWSKTTSQDTGQLSDTRARFVYPTRPTYIGSDVSGGFNGPLDMAFAAIYNRALTATEVETVYQFVKPILAAKGVTI